MSSLAFQQLFQQIERSHKPVICLGAQASGDAYASALALANVLQALQKQPAIVTADENVPDIIKFLPGSEMIKTELTDLKRYTIEIPVSQAPIKEIAYEQKDGILKLYLTPKHGSITQDQIRLRQQPFKYDLVITVGTQTLESLEKLLQTNQAFFLETPIVVIDHEPENEAFGHVNLIDVTAVSCGEIIAQAVEHIDASLLTEPVATACLFGIIAKTRRFTKTIPGTKTLQIISNLVARGAKRDLIMERLYRHHSVNTLQLWGRLLSRVRHRKEHSCVSLVVTQDDLLTTHSTIKDAFEIVDEVIDSSEDANLILFLFERAPNKIEVVAQARRPLDAFHLFHTYNPTGTASRCRFTITKESGQLAEEELASILQKQKNTPT